MSLQISLVHMCLWWVSNTSVSLGTMCTQAIEYTYILHIQCSASVPHVFTMHCSRSRLVDKYPREGPPEKCHAHLQVVASHTSTSQVLAPYYTFYQCSTDRTDVHMWGTLKLYSMDLALRILQCVLEFPDSMTQVLFGYRGGRLVCVYISGSC